MILQRLRPGFGLRFFIGAFLLFVLAFLSWHNSGQGGYKPALAANPFPPEYLNTETYSAGTAPSRVLNADFNNDGLQDLIYNTTTSAQTFNIRFGQGSGFSAPTSYAFLANTAIVDLAVADMNGDGRSDVVAASSSRVGIYYNQGQGIFTPPASAVATLTVASVLVGDFNNDNRPDIIASPTLKNSFTMLANNGNGTFTSQFRSFTLPNNPTTMATADFDQNGNQDLALAGRSVVYILSGTGTLTFTVSATYGYPCNGSNVTCTSTDLKAGDLNGDSRPDLALSVEVTPTSSGATQNPANQLVTFLSNSSDFTLTAQLYNDFDERRNLTLADFNGDGSLDVSFIGAGPFNLGVLYPNLAKSYVGVYFNAGNGSGLLGNLHYYDADMNATSLTAGNFDADNKPDIAVVHNSASGLLRLFHNDTGTTFKATRILNLKSYAFRIPVGDVNNDGFVDIVAPESNFNEISTFFSDGKGNFSLAVTSTSPGSYNGGSVLADFNNDNILDLAGVANGFVVSFGKGDGTFSSGQVYSPTGNFYGAVSGDFNNDQHIDLLFSSLSRSNVSLWLNNGLGGFSLAGVYSQVKAPFSDMDKADLNQDGNLDVVVPNTGENSISIFYGTGTGSFSPVITYAVGVTSARGVKIVDLNKDEKFDLIVRSGSLNYPVNTLPSEISVFLQGGTGVFTLTQTFTVPNPASGFVAADLDKDGNIDIAAPILHEPNNPPPQNQPFLVFLRGDGQGSLSAPQYISSTLWNTVSGADFNNDGIDDFAFSHFSSGASLSVQLTKDPGDFPLEKLGFSGPAVAVAGKPFVLQLKALDQIDGLVRNYNGTVALSGLPGLPANYSFNPADEGAHSFILTATSAATYTITATDSSNPAISGTFTLKVVEFVPGFGSFPAPSSVISVGNTPLGLEISKTLTVSRTSSAVLVVSSASFTGTHSSSFSIKDATFPLTLTALSLPQNLRVSCSPVVEGLLTAYLNFTTNDPLQPLVSYPVECAGQLLVVKNNDDGTGNVPGTLSFYFKSGWLSAGQTLRFGLEAGNIISLSGPLPPVPNGIILDGGSCGANMPVLDGSAIVGSTTGLVLRGNNILRNLLIRNFGGAEITNLAGGNSLYCVKVQA